MGIFNYLGKTEKERVSQLANAYSLAARHETTMAMVFAGWWLTQWLEGTRRSIFDALQDGRIKKLKDDPNGELYQIIFIQHLPFWPPDCTWPVHAPKNVLTPDVVGLAEEIRDKKDFSILPIFADALWDAGLPYERCIDHCRKVGVEDHQRIGGCALVEIVLASSLAWNQVKK